MRFQKVKHNKEAAMLECPDTHDPLGSDTLNVVGCF